MESTDISAITSTTGEYSSYLPTPSPHSEDASFKLQSVATSPRAASEAPSASEPPSEQSSAASEHHYKYSQPSMDIDLSADIKSIQEITGNFLNESVFQSAPLPDDESYVAEFEDDVQPPIGHQIDLKYYGDLYAEYAERAKPAKIKNYYFQIKLTQHYGKRMGNVPIAELFTDVGGLYYKELLAYEAFHKNCHNEQKRLNAEYADLKAKRKAKAEYLDKLFMQMQSAIVDFTNGLSNDNLSKHVERFVKRQSSQTNHITKLLLTHIKLKHHYDEKQEAYDDLDKLGPGYHIMDYVQLKFDNKNYRDKVDERDRELRKIRSNYKHFMQVLAHTREKIEHVKKDIVDCTSDLETVELDFYGAREQLTYIRNERDGLRKNILKMVDVLGLECKPKLLEDIATASEEVTGLKNELVALKEEYSATTKRIEVLRNNIELLKMQKN